MMVRLGWWMLGLGLGLAGCSGVDPECDPSGDCAGGSGDTGLVEATRLERENVGEVCVEGAGTLTATVTLEPCLSTCVRDVVATCSIETVGSDLVVTAEASWLPPPNGTCDSACLVLQATCTAPAPSDGDYTVTYGAGQGSATLPLGEPVCVSAG